MKTQKNEDFTRVVNMLTKCDACGEIENETIHCWDCGGDFCCASCWPKHDAEDC